jgi:hypothetical protein
VAVPYAWQNLTPESSIAWDSQTTKFPSTLIVHERDNLKRTVTQTLIPPVQAPVQESAPGSASSSQVSPVKNANFSILLNDNKTLGPFRAVERVISAKASDARARSLAEARSVARDVKGTTYWVRELTGVHLKPNEVNTVQLAGTDKSVSFYFSDSLGDIRSSLGHGMEDHLKAQYKFKGLGNGKDLRTYLAVNDKTSDSVTLTVRDGDELVDLEFYAAKEPRAIQLQRETFSTMVDERNADDVKALCYAIEESGMLKEQLATLQQHLKALLKNPQDIASNVEDIITVRSTIAETQRELAQIGRQMSVQDYKDRFANGDPATLYAKYVSEPDGELKTLAAKLFKRVQWRDQLQNQSQKKGFWTGQVSNVRLRVVEQEIKMIKQSLTTMGRALDEMIDLRKEGTSGNLAEDKRLTAWVLLRQRINELQRENFSMFPEAGATARDIRLKPWDRKNRKSVQRQKTSMMERKLAPIGMGSPNSEGVYDFRLDQKMFRPVISSGLEFTQWMNYLMAQLARYGAGTDSLSNVLVTTQVPNAGPTDKMCTLTWKGLEIDSNTRVVGEEITTGVIEYPEDPRDNLRAFRECFKNYPINPSNTVVFFIITTGKSERYVGFMNISEDMAISELVSAFNKRYGTKLKAEVYGPTMVMVGPEVRVKTYIRGTGLVYVQQTSLGNVSNLTRVVPAVNYMDDEEGEAEKEDNVEEMERSKRFAARRPSFPPVPRAFDPSSAADRGGERGGGVLFYGGADDDMDDIEQPIQGHHKSWYGGERRRRRQYKEEEDDEDRERQRDDFDMDW